MSQSLPGRVARTASVFVAGLFAASMLTANVAAAPASVASTLTRVTSCAGENFHPILSATTFDWYHNYLERTTDAGDGIFLCDPGLPNKATVTSVRFTLVDDVGAINIASCGLVRNSLGTTNSEPVAMAVVSPTGMDAAPGRVRRSDTSIDHATIDESNYSYWLQCQIVFLSGFHSGRGTGGIVGAEVTYRISSTNG